MTQKHEPIRMKLVAQGKLGEYLWACPSCGREDLYYAIPGLDERPICKSHPGTGVCMVYRVKK